MRLTKEQIKQEIRLCGQNPTYFLKNYVKITHPDKGLIPFTTYDYQDILLNDFNGYRFNIVLKSRQLGISTIVAGYAAWMMLFRREKQVLVVATKFKTAGNLVDKVKKMIKSVPDWLRISEIDVDNQTSFILANGSKIQASTTSQSDAGRSEALSLLIVDEAAHIEGMEELWTGVKPTIATGGRCIALSSPKGVGNWFYKTYSGAEAGENDFHPTNLPWNVHPDRDDKWFLDETRNMSRKDIAQEYQCSFNLSGETVIDPQDMIRIKEGARDPVHRAAFDRNYWIWEQPKAGHSYILIADVARGDGHDYSTFHVIDIDTMEQVAEYQGKPNSDIFAMLLNTTGREYGNALLAIENNAGMSVIDKMVALEYPNLYWSAKVSHDYVDALDAEVREGVIPGFSTTTKTRPLIISKVEEFIRNKVIKLNSSRLIRELETFVWNNGKAEALRGYNDDLVMALSIGCWIRDTALTANKREIAYTKAILGSMVKANTKMDTKIQGMHGYSQKNSTDPFEKDIMRSKMYGTWVFKG